MIGQLWDLVLSLLALMVAAAFTGHTGRHANITFGPRHRRAPWWRRRRYAARAAARGRRTAAAWMGAHQAAFASAYGRVQVT